MRVAGASEEQIQQRLGYKSLDAVRQELGKAAQRHMRYSERELSRLRDIELARLDHLQVVLWQEAEDGNLQAVDRILKIMQHRADLLGLKVERESDAAGHTTNVLVVGSDGENYAAELRKAAAQIGVATREVPAASNGHADPIELGEQ